MKGTRGELYVIVLMGALVLTAVIVVCGFAVADFADRAAQPCPSGTATTYDVAGYRSGCVGPFVPDER